MGQAILKYPGSKWQLADWIVSLMPAHKSYLEPFFGSGAVFFTKPRSRIETINDLDGEIVNLFRVIRDQPEALERRIALTPFSRSEFEYAWELKGDADTVDPVERARLTMVRHWMTHGSRNIYKGGWQHDRVGREYAYSLRYWNHLPERIAAVVSRLKEAQIEQMDAVELIRRFRYPNVLIYADPPYLGSTRSSRQYHSEMLGENEHKQLLEVLLAHPGPVMLSGYDNELYNDTLGSWVKLQKRALAEGGFARVETLWLNYEPDGYQITLM